MAGQIQAPNFQTPFGYDPSSQLYIPLKVRPVLVDGVNSEDYGILSVYLENSPSVTISNGNPNGQAVMANSSPVVVASDQILGAGLTTGSSNIVMSEISNMGPNGVGGGSGIGGSIPFLYNGTTYDAKRTTKVFKPIKAVSITAGTPVSVWTPASGKKFRIIAWMLSLSVAGAILFEDATGAGNEFLRTPLMAASVGLASPPMANGFLSSTANNQLFLDVSVSGTVSGFICGTEE